MTFQIRVNGAAVPHINVTDRGFMYGDGVFRTLRVQDGKALCWPRHYRRLSEDCAALNIVCPDEALLREDLSAACGGQGDGVAKIVITRGESGRGYAPPLEARPSRVVLMSPLPVYPPEYATAGIKARWCDVRLAEQPRLAGIKHLNRLENVLARMEWQDPAVAEGLLLDGHGRVVEGTMSNVFVCHNGVLATPGLSRCGVAGVTRDRVLEWAAGQGVVAVVRDMVADDVLSADEVFLCNSVAGIWPVRELGERRWAKGPVTTAIQTYLEQHDD